MFRTRHIVSLLCVLACFCSFNASTSADEPITLLGTIVKWRYPEAEIRGAEMSDGSMIAADGQRTVPSTLLKTTMSTRDSVDKVMSFYRELLARNEKNDRKLGTPSHIGRSVLINDESDDRPFAFHTILVNEGNVSTTIIITRSKDEEMTHITWKQFLKHDFGGK
ncbi:MAG: hypothetical protein U0905_03235 [Pirellulales bacterium]